MDILALRDQITARCAQEGFPFNRKGLPIETASDLINEVREYLCGDLPVALGKQIAGWVMESFSAEQLRPYGIAVNPEIVEFDPNNPIHLVLLDNREREVSQQRLSHVYYRGGDHTTVRVEGGMALMDGQAGALLQKGAFLVATEVGRIKAEGNCHVRAYNCPMIQAWGIGNMLELINSCAEVWDANSVFVDKGGRLLSHQIAGRIQVSKGGLALLENDNIQPEGKGISYLWSELPSEQAQWLLTRMDKLVQLPTAYFDIHLTLEESKAFFQQPTLERFHEAYKHDMGVSASEAIQVAKSREELAAVVLPYIESIVPDIPFEKVARHFGEQAMMENQIYSSNMPFLQMDPAKPIHLFGNLAFQANDWKAPIYLHDRTFAEVNGEALLYADGQAMAILKEKASAVAKEYSCMVFNDESHGIVSDRSIFMALDHSNVSAAGQVSGFASDKAIVHAAADGVCVLLKGAAKGDFQVGSRGLVDSPDAEVIASGYAQVVTPYALEKQKTEGAAKVVQLHDPELWNQLKSQFQKTGDFELKESVQRQIKR